MVSRDIGNQLIEINVGSENFMRFDALIGLEHSDDELGDQIQNELRNLYFHLLHVFIALK